MIGIYPKQEYHDKVLMDEFAYGLIASMHGRMIPILVDRIV
jgi:hypothetical protein